MEENEMAHPSCRVSPVVQCLFLAFLLILSPARLWAKGCAESLGPAQPPPSSLWGELQPGAILLDATGWTGSQLPNNSFPISTSVDIENGWIFHSFYGGFSIWDARTHPEAPEQVSITGGHRPTLKFPSWPFITEFTQIVFSIDVPEGNDNLAAVGAVAPVGLTIWNTTNKSEPLALYQDTARHTHQVYAARIGGRDYAFVADFQTSVTHGLYVYDMTAAKSFNSCVENSLNGIDCPGIYRGQIGGQEAAKYVHGLAVGNRHFIVKSAGNSDTAGIKIYEVTNPLQPQLVVQDFQGFSNGNFHGVALWTHNGQHYLATRQSQGLQDVGKIFNVTTCLTTGCPGLQNLEVWRSPQPIKPYPQSLDWLSVTSSRSGSTPFIYFGNQDPCRDGEADFQTEYLLDVSNPAAPRDVTPQGHITDMGRQVDYWSWYYSDTVRGWSHFGPRMARFNGPYLYRAAATIFDVHKWTPGPFVTVSGPSSGQTGTAYGFTATVGNCTPSNWSWTAGAGATLTGNGPSVSITWSSAGTKDVVATAAGCTSGTKSINITDPGALTAAFSFSPANPQANQTVTFNASASTGSPAFYFWEFPDGTNASGVTVSRAFPAGSHSVKLTVYKDCTGGVCASQASVTKSVVVTGGPPPVVASFDTSVACTSDLTGVRCAAQTGQAVTFTSTSTGNPTSFVWSFNDGTPAGSGAQVSHIWSAPGTYLVQLTASNGQSSNSTSRVFVVTGNPIAQTRSVVLPWIAQTRGALVQSSDLYVHNPGQTVMDVTLEFRKRGVPEPNPPRVPRTIQPGATLYVGDVLRELFNRENLAGFIVVTVDRGDVEPVITSFNTTFQAGGKQFGQTVSGVSMSSAGSAPGSENRLQHLVGLIDNTERLAYFGISNPNDEPATYRLKFFDRMGRQIGESAQDLTLSRFGQRQFQVKEIEDLFGVSNVADYRIEIEKKAGGIILPYASNLRLSSEDPSFIEPGATKNARSYLLGALSAPGLNNSTWRSDLLLTNVNTQAVTTQVTFTGVGLNSVPTTPVSVTLQPGQTERLENVIASRWNIRNAVGVLTVSSSSPNGVFPIVQGESYESTNTDPAKRFGQSMTALSDADTAVAGRSQYLVGMRQDAKNRTTIWIFNPDSGTAEYDVIYRPLDGGAPLGTVSNVRLGAGKMRQLSPGQHPIPAAGVANGFTVEIKVKSGKVLSAAQVINNVTNDPAYIQGEAR
jgi:PKD repeat protein